MSERPNRRIVAAAIKFGDAIVTVPRPGRHNHVLYNMHKAGLVKPTGSETQGFMTSDGLFVDRRHAMNIARDAEQLIPREHQNGPGGDLYSEDLW